MSERMYSFSCKMGVDLVSLDIYEDKLIVKNNSLNQVVDFNQIKSVSFDEENNHEFKIISGNSIFSLNVLEIEDNLFVDAFNYINDKINKSIPKHNKEDIPQKTSSSNILLNVGTKVKENSNIINALYKQTNFKKEINLNSSDIVEYSNCLVYDDCLMIDNLIFTQKIPYSFIKNVILNETDSIQLGADKEKFILNIILPDNQSIILFFMDYNKQDVFELYNVIMTKIQNTHQISYELFKSNQKDFSSVIKNSGYQQKISNNNLQRDSNLTYVENNNSIENTVQKSLINSKKHFNKIVYGNNNSNNTYSGNNTNNNLSKQKSVLIAIILHFFFIGLGYGYVGNWEKFAITFAVFIACIIFSFLLIPILLIPIVWLYALVDTISMVERYNNGERF